MSTLSDGASPLLGSVADLAHQMGAVVVAEGVETPDQLNAALAAGCDAVQGFLLGRPTDAAGCREMLRACTSPSSAAAGTLPRNAPASHLS
jgi:EAL domain-containing protein (putative c-di-GMP-specific phosphodiesterase class I)